MTPTAATLVATLVALLARGDAASTDRKQPLHIVIFLADDLGWDDVSYQGSGRIFTPNIDALALSGAILSRHYSPPLCTPSRASLLTGKYPSSTGMQHLVIGEPEPWGLPLDEVLLPEYLCREGYATHLVGKWHLGFFQSAYTPTKRGFDTHYGYWQGYQDYWTHMVRGTFDKHMNGYDMRRGLEAEWEAAGRHTTALFTEEATKILQDHDKDTPLFMLVSHLAPHAPAQPPLLNTTRLTPETEDEAYIRVVEDLDASIGAVIQELQRKQMLSKTLLLFLSDNGAPTRGPYHTTKGSNAPFRGLKQSPFEGGVHTAAAIWSAELARSESREPSGHLNHINTQLIYSADWMPTLLHAATGRPQNISGIDGVDQWPSLLRKKLTLDSSDAAKRRASSGLPVIVDSEYFAILTPDGRWKLAGVNASAVPDGWYGYGHIKQDHPYYIEKVFQSPAAMALSAASAERDATLGAHFITTPLSKEGAQRLREGSRVHCAAAVPRKPKACTFDKPCLFDLESDPCESVDVSGAHPALTGRLLATLKAARRASKPARNMPSDPLANPAFHDGKWDPWRDDEAPRENPTDSWSWWWLLLAAVVLFAVAVTCIVRGACRSRRRDSVVPAKLLGHVATRVAEIQGRDRNLNNPNGTNGVYLNSAGDAQNIIH